MKLRLQLHGHEFLKKQLASVRNLDLADVFARVARPAVILELVQICLAEQSALLAHMNSVAVRYIEQPLFQESSRTVRNHAVTLHLTETKPSIA